MELERFEARSRPRAATLNTMTRGMVSRHSPDHDFGLSMPEHVSFGSMQGEVRKSWLESTVNIKAHREQKTHQKDSPSPGGSPRKPVPVATQVNSGAQPGLQETPSPLSRSWASPPRHFNARDLNSPVDGIFTRLKADMAEKLEDALDSSTVVGERQHDEESTMESSVSEADLDPFDRPLSKGHIAKDVETMDAHSAFLESRSFHTIYRFWSRSGNLRGNLVDSVPYSVLRDVMIGMTARRPLLLYLTEKMSARQAGSNVVKILELLLRNVDLMHVPLSEETTIESLVSTIWPSAVGKRSRSRETLLVFSSHSTLRRNVEHCIMQLVRAGSIMYNGNTYDFKSVHWSVFVGSSLQGGFSKWVRRDCLIASPLTFGRPVGGLTPEIDPDWLEMHCTLMRAVHQDDDMARWTRDLVSLLRVSPHLNCSSLAPGAADMIQLSAKAHALIEGRAYVLPSDYRGSIRDSLRHHLQTAANSPHTEMEILQMAMDRITPYV